MPPVRGGRASKACEACRSRKTRCYESGTGSLACLRCSTLHLRCSLEDASERALQSQNGVVSRGHDCGLMEERVAYLEKAVERLAGAVGKPAEPTSHGNHANESQVKTQEHAAPLAVIRDAASDESLRSTAMSGMTTSNPTVIDKGILTASETQDLLEVFQRHYGRWIAIRESGHERLNLEDIRSPLLLCACSLIAVRHLNADNATEKAALLFEEAKALLNESLLSAPQSLEFFQAVLILSLWSTTIGQKPLSLDSWLISGFALQHAAASDVFGPKPSALSNSSRDIPLYEKRPIWNHLCLSHLHACVSMRRRSMLTIKDLDKAKTALHPGQATNFETRMVAEVYLYWTIYENCWASAMLPKAKAALQTWRNEWSFLFVQERNQFLHMSFLFGQLLMYEQSLNNKSAAVRESIVSDMIQHCSEILSLSMATADDRTRHLTDHIYHMITFAAVTLCRLLCKYETQIKVRHDIEEIDALVSKTILWLHGIGLPSHIGQTMGSVINKVQRKLRPNAQGISGADREDYQSLPDELFIPEFLGMDSLEFDWDTILPDWQSFASDELISPVAAV